MEIKFGLFLSLILTFNTAFACNFETGEREQLVQISIDGQGIGGFLTLEELDRKSIDLKDGGTIAVSVAQATDAKYEEILARSNTLNYTTELVDLSVVGVSGSGKIIDMGSYSGANSLQTFQSVGDSKQKVEILLLKQICVGPSVAKNN